MSRVLPAGWPGAQPEILFLPGYPHYYENVQSLAEQQNYQYCLYGKQHAGQIFGQFCVSGRSFCTRSSAGMIKVLEYMFIPRPGMTFVGFDALFASDGGGNIKVKCPDNANFTTVAVGAGASIQVGGTVEINLGSFLWHLDVYLDCSGTYLDLLGFSFWDADLTDAGLP